MVGSRASFAASAVLTCCLIGSVVALGNPRATGDRVTDSAVVQVALQSWLMSGLGLMALVPHFWRGRMRWFEVYVPSALFLALMNILLFLGLMELYDGRLSQASRIWMGVARIISVISVLATIPLPLALVIGWARGRAVRRGVYLL